MQDQVLRAPRVPLPIPIMYRRTGEDIWFQRTIVNLSETGVLFAPAELQPGAEVEVILSPPIEVGSTATGKQVCLAEVVRATMRARRRHGLRSAVFYWSRSCAL